MSKTTQSTSGTTKAKTPKAVGTIEKSATQPPKRSAAVKAPVPKRRTKRVATTSTPPSTSDAPVTANGNAETRPPGGKLGQIVTMLERPEGATLADLMAATGWQAHSVRGVLSTLKKRLGRPLVVSLAEDNLRLYRLAAQ